MRKNRLQKFFSCGSSVTSFGIALDGFAVVRFDGWLESTKLVGVLPIDQCEYALYEYVSDCK